jgi:hypothetical protein
MTTGLWVLDNFFKNILYLKGYPLEVAFDSQI